MSSEPNLAMQIDPEALRAADVAPRPQSLDATGLSLSFLCDLTEKHLFEGGVLALRDLARRTALSGRLLEEILNFLRKEGRIEVRTQIADDQGLRYALTDRGRGSALAALTGERLRRSGARAACRLRSRRAHAVGARLHRHARSHAEVFQRRDPGSGDARSPRTCGELGQSNLRVRRARHRQDLHDAEARSSVRRHVSDPACHRCRRHCRFASIDSSVHKQIRETTPSVMLNRGHDPRFVLCRRPVVVTGGELTADMLESAVRRGHSPVSGAAAAQGERRHLHSRRSRPSARRAGDGSQSLDRADGRRRRLSHAQHRAALLHALRCDPGVLDQSEPGAISSTTRSCAALATRSASMRSTAEQYHAIWRDVCEENDVAYDPASASSRSTRCMDKSNTPMLPCHPRDLIGMALDRMEYLEGR